MTPAAVILAITVLVALLLTVFLIWYLKARSTTLSDTQAKLSDRDLLLRIVREPDGFVSPNGLSQVTRLTKGEARTRLQTLAMAGILDSAYNSRLQTFYSLRHPPADREVAQLSPEPFLTVDDLLTIFEQYDWRPRDQDLILATGLPLALIRREMKYFINEAVVDQLYFSEGYGKQSQRLYVLREPYRSQPEAFRRRAGRDDLQLRTILRNDNLIV